jgi:hypothetical protein
MLTLKGYFQRKLKGDEIENSEFINDLEKQIKHVSISAPQGIAKPGTRDISCHRLTYDRVCNYPEYASMSALHNFAKQCKIVLTTNDPKKGCQELKKSISSAPLIFDFNENFRSMITKLGKKRPSEIDQGTALRGSMGNLIMSMLILMRRAPYCCAILSPIVKKFESEEQLKWQDLGICWRPEIGISYPGGEKKFRSMFMDCASKPHIRFIVIPTIIDSEYLFHANLIIYDVYSKIAERLDPYEKEFDYALTGNFDVEMRKFWFRVSPEIVVIEPRHMHKLLIESLRELQRDMNERSLEKVDEAVVKNELARSYRQATGLQKLQESDVDAQLVKSPGFCLTWSMHYALLRLKYPLMIPESIPFLIKQQIMLTPGTTLTAVIFNFGDWIKKTIHEIEIEFGALKNKPFKGKIAHTDNEQDDRLLEVFVTMLLRLKTQFV